MVGVLLLALASLSQQGPEITVGIRPRAIRIGDQAVLTVMIRSADGFPDQVDLIPPTGLAVVDFRDRSSAGVGGGRSGSWVLQRDFVLEADDPGEYALPPVQVVLGGVTWEAASPTLTVSPVPLRWPTRTSPGEEGSRGGRRSTDPVVPRDTPPATGEMQEARPQDRSGYEPWHYWYAPWGMTGYPGQIPGVPWAPPGQAPVFGGGGGDPWGGAINPWGGAGYPQGGGLAPGGTGSLPPYGPNGGWPIRPPGANPAYGMGWTGGWWGPGGYGGGGGYPGGGYPGGGYPGGATSGAAAPVGPGYGTGPGSVAGAGGTPTLPAIPGGRWPSDMGGGWAETAGGDPWWPEIVPELFSYATEVGSPEGRATLAVGITPMQVFAGQQATLVATATFRPGAFLGSGVNPEYLPPDPRGFWVVDLPDPSAPLPTSSQGSVGQGYTFRRALFPLESGEHRIPPAVLLLPGAGAGSGGWDSLAAEPLHLSVLPVPAASDLPGYGGAVGRYRLEATITPTRLAVGETALLVVRILGVGNIRAVPAPAVGPVYGAEVAPAGDGAAVEVKDGVVGGVRTFTWMVVPTEPGPVRIDPITFSYFDPYLGDFGQVASEELLLDVTEFPERR